MKEACTAFPEYSEYFKLVIDNNPNELMTSQRNLYPILINCIKDIYNVNTQIEKALYDRFGITVTY